MRKVLFLFGILEDTDVQWLGSIGKLVQLESGNIVIREGEPAAFVYLVIDGSCSVIVGGKRKVAELMPGEVVGEMSFVDSRPPSASVQASTRTLLLAIPRDLLQQRIESDAPFASRFYRALAVFLATRLRASVAQLGYGSPDASHAEPDEIDPDALERLSTAGLRFDDLQRRLRGHA
jgi:CRP-like cAMP-binding protein